ncbi:fused response regulator/phosphatase [Rhodovulum sp. 12E13]|nr:fused response regulator/phosphatase [Rhodovulum sp. 12E13]
MLVVDDSRMQRRIICAQLRTLGYSVREAESGDEALAACAAHPPDFVISDWMMPGMDGPEFCRRFRQMERESYGYFLLLTAKSDRGEIAAGFDSGADDFLTKPVQSEELRARLAAGARVLRMEAELVEKNALLLGTLAELQEVYEAVDKDLIEARKLQQSLVKERFRQFGASQVSLLLRPSGHVGGDLVGFFPVGDDRLAIYAIDVSGHGVASALMTARLSSYFASSMPDRNVALGQGDDGLIACHPPAEVARRLNLISLAEMATDTYFTMLFAEIDLASGAVRMVQAGHPHPLIQRKGGRIERLGEGGPPVGLIEEAPFADLSVTLAPGDRLLFISDGITECENPSGQMLEEAGLERLVRRNAGLTGQGFLEALTWDLATYADGEEFGDDISAVLFEYGGPRAAKG